MFQLGRNVPSWGFLVLSDRRFYLRKPSYRPVDILPNARREVSIGLQHVLAAVLSLPPPK
jgi:hypothetical protein